VQNRICQSIAHRVASSRQVLCTSFKARTTPKSGAKVRIYFKTTSAHEQLFLSKHAKKCPNMDFLVYFNIFIINLTSTHVKTGSFYDIVSHRLSA